MNETAEHLCRHASIDAVQAEEYSFPYHYIPSPRAYLKFSKHWHYAPSYLAAVSMVSEWLLGLSSVRSVRQHSHMDYGCGDGGFLYALNQNNDFAHVGFEGIDIDDRAIRWAELFSRSIPNLRFRRGDLAGLEKESYDSGTLIEVLEHIPPAEAPRFIGGIAASLKRGAQLFVTVPSTEEAVTSKHYRHFDFQTLRHCFATEFDVLHCFGFERTGFAVRVLKALMMNTRLYIETSVTSKYMVKEFARKHERIHGCGRIGLILERK